MKFLPVLGVLGTVVLAGCVSRGDMGLSQQQWQQLNAKQQREYRNDYRQIKRFQRHRQYQPGATKISVKLSGGTAKMAPDFDSSRFYTTKFFLREGQCRQVPLIAVEKAMQANLTVCYNAQVLSFDPSRYKVSDQEGTLFFNYNPVWRHGFTYYGVNSTGYVGLDDVDISVRAVAPREIR
ncbi:MAG: hypothetical protein P1U34_00190 [Coxiellaceae bacterium]|nr:hypothetical protein [Coxiellaceae bacterium]